MSRKRPGEVSGEVRVTVPRLHPGQEALDAAANRFVTLMCGRRWGKTVYGIRKVLDAALQGHKVGWFSPNYRYADETYEDLLRRLGDFVVRQDAQKRRIECANGALIEVWSLENQDSGRSRAYHLIIIDEAGLVPNLKRIWDEALRPTLADYRGRAMFLGTPKGAQSDFVRLHRAAVTNPNRNWTGWAGKTRDNPYIPVEEIEEARASMPPEAFAQEYEGVPADDGGNPFGLDAIDDAWLKISPSAGEGNRPVVWGADLARAVDSTVAIGMDAYRGLAAIDRWQAPWGVTRMRLVTLLGTTPAIVDATGVGDPIVEDLQRDGAQVAGFRFTMPSKMKLIERLIAAFQRRELCLHGAPDWLRAELEAFGFVYSKMGIQYSAPDGGHDDGVMALALALHGWDRVQGSVPADIALEGPRGDDRNAWVRREIDGVAVGHGLTRQYPALL
jgi:hypothetical protein